MTQQYLRRIQLVVADDAKGIDLSELHIKFAIKAHDLQTPNVLQARVFNVKDSTAAQIQKEFSKIILSAGYEGGELGTIFDGTLVQVRKGRESPVDTYVDLSGADGDIALNFGTIQIALKAGSSFSDRVDALAKAMGVKKGYIAPLPDDTLPRGKTMFGMARDHLRDLSMATDTNYSIQNGVLQILPRGAALPGETIEINSATGMIGFPEQTEDGIQVKCLLNPQIKVGSQVRINNADIQQAELGLSLSSTQSNAFLPSIAADGLYRTLVVEHSGDTRGQEWYTDLICIAVGQAVTPGLLARGYS
jgi:hypothetical protein